MKLLLVNLMQLELKMFNHILLPQWVGTIELIPSGDEWFETEVAPDLIINVEGNFDTVFLQIEML